ncbi:MAG: Bacterial extracellular solute-binding proteins, family 5 Middle [Lentisphaerae bacterium ADurb.BinA184]|nr:MAG: Bacterial extracellular solute-binding proteins, family 5 Middle [Lentisphaerae bacterium ADurb.BinA184]
MAPRPESPFYNDHMARQYTAYDVERANQHLDKAGCTLRDLSGFRLRPDGRRVALVIEVADTPVQSAWPAVAERVCAAWRDVGVEASLRVQDADALFWRRLSNAFDAVVCEGGSGVAVQVEPAYYLPASPLRSSFAPGWAYWYLAPSHPLAEEPPAPARLQLALYEKAKATTDEPERIRLMNQILTICQNEFYGIGICRARQGRAVIHRDFRNVPALMSCGWEFPDPAPGNSCQFYLAPAGRGAVAGPDRGE